MDCSNFFFEFVTLLPQPPETWAHKHVPPYPESFQCVPHKTMEHHSVISELPMLTSSCCCGESDTILRLLHQNIFQSPKPDHKHLFVSFPLEKPNN